MKGSLFFLGKIVISISMLALLINHVEYDRFAVLLNNTAPFWLLFSTAVLVARNWLFGWRCRTLLQAKGLEVPLSYAATQYFTSQFFNMFMPTSLGGDVARGYYLSRRLGHRADVAATVVMERLLGFIALIIVLLLSMPFWFLLISDKTILYVALALCLVVFLGVSLLLFYPTTRPSLLSNISAMERPLRQFSSLLSSLRRFRDRRRLTNGLIQSLLVQLAGIYSAYLLAVGLGQTISFSYFLLIMPLIFIISMFPFTLNGLGVREGAFVYLFSLVGIDMQVGLWFSLLFLAQLLVLSAIGGVTFSLQNDRSTDSFFRSK
jgi:uncharacterized protein (TIRG00374 family)